MTAAVFNISKAKDENGNIIEPVCEYTAGLLRQVYLQPPRAIAMLIRSLVTAIPNLSSAL